MATKAKYRRVCRLYRDLALEYERKIENLREDLQEADATLDELGDLLNNYNMLIREKASDELRELVNALSK